MNTSNKVSKFPGRSLLLALFVTVALSGANAGPGPDYWRRTEQGGATRYASQTNAPASADKVCATARTETLTELRPTLPNGKGALQRVTVGSRQVCESCATTTVMRPGLPNGKGALRSVKVATTHTCDASCDKG
ncbi:hypothetical protein OpiT1DRAFT_01036 [Opitutaceae bacterium TAV1]|nr:hypothetical protein OpiT1DRAFT_01036 [Opitutaceae bacterium TAV1]